MKIREVIPYILIGVLGFMFIQARCDLRHDIANNTLEPFVLPDDVVMRAELNSHTLKLAQRIGGDSVYVSTTYVPTESSIEYVVQTDTIAMGQLESAHILLDQLQQQMTTAVDSARVDSLETAIHNLERALYTITVDYDTHGFCCVPELGFGIDSDLNPNIEGGARFYYIDRFGIGLHGALEIPTDSTEKWDGSVGIFGDWRIPGLDNAALFGSIDYDSPGIKFMGGAHIYLK